MNNTSREAISKALFNLISADFAFRANTHSSTVINGISEHDYQGLYFGEEISGPGIVAGTVITDLPTLGTINVFPATTATTVGVALAGKTFRRSLRRLVSLADVGVELRPHLCLWEYKEEHRRPLGPSSPPEIFIDYMAFVYVSTKTTSAVEGPSPMSLLNPVVDAVTLSLAPPLQTMAQTLGTDSNGMPICQDCYTEGTIDKRGGDLDGDAIAIIPLRVLIPW